MRAVFAVLGGALGALTFASLSLADARPADTREPWHILLQGPAPIPDQARRHFGLRGIDAHDPWTSHDLLPTSTPIRAGTARDTTGDIRPDLTSADRFHRWRPLDTTDPWSALPIVPETPALRNE